MKVQFDFNLEAWVTGVEVEGNSYPEARENLLQMSFEDLITKGYIKDFELSTIDAEIIQEDLNINVVNIEYDTDAENFPEEMQIKISAGKDDDIEDLIEHEIYKITKHIPKSFDYDIIGN